MKLSNEVGISILTEESLGSGCPLSENGGKFHLVCEPTALLNSAIVESSIDTLRSKDTEILLTSLDISN